MSLLNRRKRKADDEDKFSQSVAYENLKGESSLDSLIMLYDEKSIILFGTPKNKPVVVKKV